MSLAEIETAAEELSLDQKRQLLEFLASRLNGNDHARKSSNLSEFARALRLTEDPLAWQQRVRG